ncbi:MAG: MOSC domain-containing protein [Candidatus Polarisedimenticolia bacterium]
MSARKQSMAEVVSVNVSVAKGTKKVPAPQVELRPEHGIVGDAHAGKWHRQVSLLAQESVDQMVGKLAAIGVTIHPGDFAENILTRGIVLKTLPIGTRLKVGGTLLEVTQIGKECHFGCEIRRQVGDCVMPREGIFAKVIEGGVIRAGDAVEQLPAAVAP